MAFNAKADPAKSAGIARATAANNSAALTVALVSAGALKTVDEAQKHFWAFYLELVPELIGENSAPPAQVAKPKPAPKAADNVTPITIIDVLRGASKAEDNLQAGGLTDAPGDYVVTFGKYKGKTLAAIHAEDPEYIAGNDGWAGLVKSRNADVAAAAQAFLASIA